MGVLDNKVAIVTGGGRGLGRGLALALAREGAAVVVNSTGGTPATKTTNIQDPRSEAERRVNTASRVVAEIEQAGGRAIAVPGIIGSREVAEQLVTAAVETYGRLDIVVNNAAVALQAPFETYTDEMYDDTMWTNLRGTWMNARVAVDYWVANKIRGRIINISSAAGIYGSMVHAAYAASKGGINAMTMALARELGPKYGITANAVAPVARTEMFDGIRPVERRDQIEQLFASISNIQRMGTPDDVAPVVVFLASEASQYITGQVISATGFGHVISKN